MNFKYILKKIGLVVVFFLGILSILGSGGGGGGNDTSKHDTNNPSFSSQYIVYDNMGREVKVKFKSYILKLETNKKLDDNEKISKDSKAVYGYIDGENTGSLIKINSNYSKDDNLVLKIFDLNNNLLSTKKMKYIGNDIFEFEK